MHEEYAKPQSAYDFDSEREAWARQTKSVPAPQTLRVTVVDFDMSFEKLVTFLIKLSFAAIPALIVIAITSVFVVVLLGGLFARLGYR